MTMAIAMAIMAIMATIIHIHLRPAKINLENQNLCCFSLSPNNKQCYHTYVRTIRTIIQYICNRPLQQLFRNHTKNLNVQYSTVRTGRTVEVYPKSDRKQMRHQTRAIIIICRITGVKMSKKDPIYVPCLVDDCYICHFILLYNLLLIFTDMHTIL